ncbi:MAG: ABC transporter ATP-binding protein [Chitinophagaceae bacterium BSSC1]|nr:MAG: ABC transporter ATP-binding protein [Chitinophagaceae bacterium BSSC1]
MQTELSHKDPTPIISIQGLAKSFGPENQVLKGLNLKVAKGESVVLLGRSGSGKSVAIKCMVGLIAADSGSIKVFDKDMLVMSPQQLNETRLKIGFLFQSAALYDSMTVAENLGFPLRRHSPELSESEIDNSIKEALESVGLLDAIQKMPSDLSGGMRKRIAMARTLILKPEIMLYDEPTTGLDTITSREISDLMLKIQEDHQSSSIIITHDLACAKRTGNKVAILKDGVIGVEGTYEEVSKSNLPWVQDFFID